MKKSHSDNENNNASYTEKYQDHISFSFAYKVVCTDDRFSKPVILYRGKNAARKLIEAILEEYDYCKNIIKKHFNKTLAMPAEDEMKLQSSNKSGICNKLFVAGYNKVRDHDNVTGKYKGFLIGVVILILNWLKYFIIWKASFM